MIKNKKCKICKNKHYGKGYCQKHYTQLLRYGKVRERTQRDPNKIIDCGNYCKMVLYNRKCEEVARTKFDKDKLEKVKKFKWCLNKDGYVRNKKSLRLHQLILGKKKGYVIDHINHDILDNRNKNLRHCTHQENIMNRKGVKGICWEKKSKKWRAYINKDKKRINLGYFKLIPEALEVRRQAELKYFGRFACIE